MNQELKFKQFLKERIPYTEFQDFKNRYNLKIKSEQLKDGSIATYLSSLNNLKKDLNKAFLIKNPFEYKNFNEFYSVAVSVLNDYDFKKLNKDNRARYSSAINRYLFFLKKNDENNYDKYDEEYNKHINDINISEKDRLTLINNSQKPIKFSTPKIKKLIRDPKTGKLSLEQSGYKCELNSSHLTFTSNTSGKQYMEAHHLIPYIYENCKKYDRHLDFIENIISLCPNCHRAVHFGDKKTKNEILRKLFDKRKEQLNKNLQINLTLEELLSLY